MKLDNIDQRHKAVETLIQKAFEIDALYLHDKENLDDWIGATEINDHLLMIREMIRTESLFLDAVAEMDEVPVRNADNKKIFLSIVEEKRLDFIVKILLHMLEFALDYMTIWENFKTPIGKKFYKDTERTLKALQKKYQDLSEL
ncbi:MAG: hypothetical protein IJP68_08920 [Selenomonadaceae bacterium]|nr:hypothetical protein [Selenomonadaceae bacterium]